jgi:hypothetical protein
MRADRSGQKTAGAGERHVARYHVHSVAAVDLGEAEHNGGERIDRAADDRLRLGNEAAGGHERVVAEMRHRRMRPGPAQRDGEIIARRHLRPNARGERAERQAGPVVKRENILGRKAVEQALVDHALAAAVVFLRRLEHEMDRAVEVARRGQIARRAEQDAGVAVVAAGVHHARTRRRIGDIVLLLDRQRVHVGAERNRSLAAPRA